MWICFKMQCFAQSSIDTIWWYLQLIFKLTSAEGTTKLFQLNIVQNIVLKTNALYQFISWPFSIFDATVIHNLDRVPNLDRGPNFDELFKSCGLLKGSNCKFIK